MMRKSYSNSLYLSQDNMPLKMTIRFTFFSIIILAFLFGSCNFKKETKDTDTNRYYAEYLRIYNKYGKVPLDTTINQMKNYLVEFPEEARAWCFLGQLTEKHNIDSAIQYYQKALKLDSNFAATYGALGALYGRLGDFDKAKDYIANGLAHGDTSVHTSLNMLLTLAKKADTLEFQKIVEQSKIKDKFSDYHKIGMYWAMKKLGREKQADSLWQNIPDSIKPSSTVLKKWLDSDFLIDSVLSSHYK
jgi:tetratricopeptide (TPR) repeat protein